MSTSYTTTNTVTSSRYVTGKLEADLRQVHHRAGRPDEARIVALVHEANHLIRNGYFEWAEYGFRKGGKWIYVLRYDAAEASAWDDGSRSGGIQIPDVSGATWYTFLSHTAKYSNLGQAEQAKVDEEAGIIRTAGTVPDSDHLRHIDQRSYTHDSLALRRVQLA